MVLLGVDGGGTRTRVVLIADDGTILGVGESGPGNYHDVGLDVVAKNVQQALDKAWQQSATTKTQPHAAFLGMAGVGTAQDREAIERIAKNLDLAPAKSIRVDHDLRIALAGGLSGRPGIAVIAGTGSGCFGRSARGNEWRAGGWGSVLDDGGSSYDLGRRALTASIRDLDERGPRTSLCQALIETLELTELREVTRLLREGSLNRVAIAKLAPLVTKAAHEGDAVAVQIIDQAVAELVLMITTVARKIQEPEAEMVACGGLANCGPVYFDPLHRSLRNHLPNATLLHPELEPVLGAALLAAELAGARVEPRFLNNLKSKTTLRGHSA